MTARLALHWQILIAMLLGAALGVGLNASVGRRTLEQPQEHAARTIQRVGMPQSVDVPAGRFWSFDSASRTLLQVDRRVGNDQPPRYATRRIVIGEEGVVAARREAGDEPWPALPPQADADAAPPRETYATPGELSKHDPQAYALWMERGRSTARRVADAAHLAGNLFLRMLKMVSAPLIIASLLTGVTGLGQAGRLGRMFGRTLLYYVSTSMIAIVIGLAMVNLFRPGVGVKVAAPAAAEPLQGGKSLAVVLVEQLHNMIPENPFAAVAEGQFLSIIAFTLAFAVCTVLVGGNVARHIRDFSEAAFEVVMKLTMLIIRLAPIGVFFLMLSATASQGLEVFGSLGWYLLTVACALGFHAVIVLPAILHFVARRNPLQYANALSPALVTAFSSASSNGTLPLTMTCVEQRAGISNRVASFVLPLGATVNMDGTALYEAVAVLFIAQFTGHDLALADQIVVALTALLASIGAAGIPHAGLVMMVIILQAVNLPTESQGLIIAVDRILDMLRTSVNVWSDACGCAVVSRLEVSSAAPEGRLGQTP
ncbi:MAG: dicarboxylate/amino acid:cation symporter [Planctomycetales bacterium]|nr:dicarboxylate/amino acid:cation symporter [Planctomycetales bacterium]